MLMQRRTFLGLTAAGLVGAYTDAWPLHPLAPRVEAPLPTGIGAHGLLIHELCIDELDGDQPVKVTLSRLPGPTVLLQCGVMAHSYFRWVAPLYEGFVLMPGQTLEINPGGPRWAMRGQDAATGRIFSWVKGLPHQWLDVG